MSSNRAALGKPWGTTSTPGQAGRVQQQVHQLVEQQTIHEIAGGERIANRFALHCYRERNDAVLIFKAGDDIDQICQIFLLHSAEFRMLQQMLLERILAAGLTMEVSSMLG